jgi:hypothetical protein
LSSHINSSSDVAASATAQPGFASQPRVGPIFRPQFEMLEYARGIKVDLDAERGTHSVVVVTSKQGNANLHSLLVRLAASFQGESVIFLYIIGQSLENVQEYLAQQSPHDYVHYRVAADPTLSVMAPLMMNFNLPWEQDLLIFDKESRLVWCGAASSQNFESIASHLRVVIRQQLHIHPNHVATAAPMPDSEVQSFPAGAAVGDHMHSKSSTGISPSVPLASSGRHSEAQHSPHLGELR